MLSPKMVYKTLFLNKFLAENHYIDLCKTLDDRNKLSHIYREEMYDDIYINLIPHLLTLQNLVAILNT